MAEGRSSIHLRGRVGQGPGGIRAQYLAGGGTQDDGSIAYSFWAKSDVLIKMSAQLERYSLPILGGRRQNAAFAIQTTYSPKWESVKKSGGRDGPSRLER